MNKKFEPVIVAAVRTAVGKAKRGSLVTVRPEDMMATVINACALRETLEALVQEGKSK